jgi:internalin A
LRRIQLRVGRDARTMLVATHCAERRPELDYPHLEQAFPGMLTGSFDVDSSTGAGFATLREAIGEQAARLPQMGQLISPRWVRAREEILAHAEVEPQIRYEQFADICERHGVTGPEIATLAELMHDLGLVIYYGNDEGLRDIVVLNPEWLTRAISYVLEDESTRQAGGVLDHARLKDIWQDRDDELAYPPRYHPYFLRLMEKFDISYRLEGDELHSLVAQLVPHERPVLPWQSSTHPPAGIRTLTLVCRLSEPVPGLIPWLTVRHHRASTGLYWRRGVFLRHPIAAYASEALLELRHNGELAVNVRAPSPDLYFNVLRDSIEDLITRRWPGLTYRLFIPCPWKAASGSPCPGQFPLDGLLRVREGGLTTTVVCMECAQVHEISVLLTGFAVPDLPLAAELQQMHDQLTDIKSSITGVQSQAAEIAETVRRVQRVVSAEVTDCPRLFTLAEPRAAGSRRARFYEHHYKLTLWCEHPGYWHPWAPASYELDTPKEWFAQIRPYATLVFKTLQLVVPLAGSIAIASLPQSQLETAQAHLEVMTTLVTDLPSEEAQDVGENDLGEMDATGQLTTAEGQGLRALRVILLEHDHLRSFGGMRRVQAPSGDFLWVCTDHYSEYDPGLPIVP